MKQPIAHLHACFQSFLYVEYPNGSSWRMFLVEMEDEGLDPVDNFYSSQWEFMNT